MEAFAELGKHIQEAWSRTDFAERDFPSIATSALEKLRLHQRFSSEALCRRFLLEPPPCEQEPPLFGQPPLTVFRDERFKIDVLYWLDSTTTIHQHAFSGAFQVLEGGSLHGQHEFHVSQRLDAGFRIGELKLRRFERLHQGDIRTIHSGPSFIHSLFHVENPSISLVVRTHCDVDSLPQWSYRPPFIAVDPFAKEPVRELRNQLVRLIRTRHPEQLGSLLEAFVATQELPSIYHILSALTSDDQGWELVARLVPLIRQRHGASAEVLLPVLCEQRRQRNIIYCRVHCADAELRYFFALLLNCPNRRELLFAVQDAYAQDPKLLIHKWLTQLTVRRGKSVALFGVEFEPDRTEELDVIFTLLGNCLRGIIDGLSGAALKQQLAASLPPQLAGSQADNIAAVCDALCQPSFALAPLLRE